MARQARINLKHELRRLARKAGYDVAPFNAKWHPAARRGRLMKFLQIDVVLDVGANTGQYAHELRNDLGFDGRICSFEPMSAAFRTLQARAAGDPKWTTFNFALGDAAGRTTINVAENSESSSILEMLPAHLSAEPESRFVGTEEIETQRLMPSSVTSLGPESACISRSTHRDSEVACSKVPIDLSTRSTRSRSRCRPSTTAR